MTILYGAAQGVPAGESPATRFHLRAGDQYLHWSAGFLTDNRLDAWSGTVQQARACRRKYPAAADCKVRRIITIPQLTMAS